MYGVRYYLWLSVKVLEDLGTCPLLNSSGMHPVCWYHVRVKGKHMAVLQWSLPFIRQLEFHRILLDSRLQRE